MKMKGLAIGKSCIWCLIILLFPIASGTLSAILALDTVKTLLLQGMFMAAACIPPVALRLSGKWDWADLGFARFDRQGCKRALWFIPVLAIFIPAAINGFSFPSADYGLGCLFLYLFVGISEEIYFRGIIPKHLRHSFSTYGIVLSSSVIFAIGHLATAFSGMQAFAILLSVVNAFLFGWMAIEMTLLSANILPAALIHFLFDFETKIVALSDTALWIAEGVRGALMLVMAIWMAIILRKKECRES